MALTHSPSIVRDGLVICLDAGKPSSYPASGTTWYDLYLKGNNGTLTNGPTYSNGAIVLDGTNDYVDLSSSTYTYTTQNSCLVAFKPADVTNYYGEVFQKGTRNDFAMRFDGITGKFQWIYSVSTAFIAYSTSEVLTNNQWYIAQMTVDTTTNLVARFYLNGVKREERSITSGTLVNTNSELRVGNMSEFGGTEVYNGSVAVVHMYDRFLTESEIQQNYNAIRGRFGL